MRVEFIIFEGKLICPICGAPLTLNTDYYPIDCWVCYECDWMGIVPDDIVSIKDKEIEKKIFKFFRETV